MDTQRRIWIVIGIFSIFAVTIACGLPMAGATPTPTSGVPPVNSSGGTGGNNSSSSGGSSNGGSNSSNSSNNSIGITPLSTDAETPTPTRLPDTTEGPYVVKQIETLGGEVISGIVCSTTKPFTVLSVTPHAPFTFVFVPQNAQQGKVSYAYSIPSAGESHDAAGTYTLAQIDKDGTLQLSLSVSDHVVFKGFDGNIPNRYKFNLVPVANATCPPTP